MTDPNCDGQMYDGDKPVTWRTVKKLCAKYKIPFVNQSFAALVMQLLNNVVKPKRVHSILISTKPARISFII